MWSDSNKRSTAWALLPLSSPMACLARTLKAPSATPGDDEASYRREGRPYNAFCPIRRDFSVPLPRLPWVRQGSMHLCWAASLESVLMSTWPGRPRLSMSDLRSRYSSHLNHLGDITPHGFRQIGHDLRFREILVGEHVRAERLVRLLQSQRPLLLVDNSTGMIMHTRVLYGVHISRGAIELLLMDFMRGYISIPVGTVLVLTVIGFFAPNEVVP